MTLPAFIERSIVHPMADGLPICAVGESASAADDIAKGRSGDLSSRAASALSTIRNIGITAHIDAGKTTTTERILFYSGVTRRIGEVDDGASVMDWMQQEQERGISITAASTAFRWRAHMVNLIDTPGHVDFTIEVERSLRVLDGVVAIFCAVGGVESQSETVWRQADRYKVPRIAFINKCDRVGADPNAVVEAMRARLRAHPLVLQMPHTLEGAFDGIIDLIHMRSRSWDDGSLGMVFEDGPIPPALAEEAALAREMLLEELAEVDEPFMARFLEGGPIEPADIAAAVRRATLSAQAVPVFIGAAVKNKGIHDLLDGIVDYLPSPADVPPVRGVLPGVEDAATVRGAHPDGPLVPGMVERPADRDAPTCALAFKITVDPAVGPLTYFRVYSGCVQSGDSLLNATKGTHERMGRILRMHANERVDVKAVPAGHIGAALGLRTTTTGDTLCDAAAPVVLDSIYCPEPVVEVAIEAETDEDADRLADALGKLAAEDPSFRAIEDRNTSQMILAGMGELHLDILTDRLRREFQLNVRIGKPQVAYRETITATAAGDRRYVKQTGCPGLYGHVRLEIAPTERGRGYAFENTSASSEIPREYVAAIEAGVAEGIERGILAGFPLTDLRVTLTGGSHHLVDSSKIAFKIAGSLAFEEALRHASATLLEPLMTIEVVTPDEFTGEVIGDLSSRRGKITGIQARSGVQVIAGLVPLASMFGYATDLRSNTQGRATYTMQFETYADVPTGIRETIIARAKGTLRQTRRVPSSTR